MTESASDPMSVSDSLLSSPLLLIAATLVVAVGFYVLSFWITGRINKSRQRARQNHIADGGADIYSRCEPMPMFERQTWAIGSALWVAVSAAMVTTNFS